MLQAKKLEFCKQNFYYFVDIIRNKIEFLTSIHTDFYPLLTFFDEEYVPTLYHFFSSFVEEKIYIVEHDKQIGFTTFCCVLGYFTVFSEDEKRVLIITDGKNIQGMIKKIIEITIFLKPLTGIEASYSAFNRTINFSNEGQIVFFNDTTYDFIGISKCTSLLIADGAAMKNFDKLTFTIERIIHGEITKKAILNFNMIPPIFLGSDHFNVLQKEFKNYITNIHITK